MTYGQETKKIDIRQAASFEVNEKLLPDAKILKSNRNIRVHLHHDGMDIWSDIAYFYETQNFFEAEGNVIVKQGDSLQLNSEYINYSGITKYAIAKHKVRLQNQGSTLRTGSLYFDRNKQEAFYNTFGEITSQETMIRSQSGTYVVDENKYEFITNVHVTDPSFTIYSKRMDYYTDVRHAYFYGATTIQGESYDVECNRGFFDSNFNKGFFQDRASINYNFRNIQGDSIYFDDQNQYAAASENVQITDTIGDNVIRGEYGEIFKEKDSAIVTQNAIAIKLVDKDSLFIHADTLLATGPAEERILTGYYGVRIFKTNLSGISDSIYINQKSGLIQLLRNPISDRESQLLTSRDMTKRNPVLWSAKTQMSGDVIHLLTDSTSNAIDSLKIFNNAIVAEQDSLNPAQFNQMKGINLYGNFNDDQLQTIDIVKNAEMVYYLYDDTTKDLIGVDKAICSAMQLQMADNQIQSVTFLTKPEGAVYPIEELPEDQQQLGGFYWRGNEMIRSKKDLIINKTKGRSTPDDIKFEETRLRLKQIIK
jgi:lipopolysaccharide export system protein LptA